MGPNEWSAATFWDLNASALLQIGGITRRRSGKCFIVAHNTKKKKRKEILAGGQDGTTQKIESANRVQSFVRTTLVHFILMPLQKA